MGKTITLSDLGDLEKKMLATAKEKFPKEFDKFLVQVVSEIEAKAVERTPVKTGLLEEQWTIGKVKGSGDNHWVELYNPVEYAEHVEYGHRKRGRADTAAEDLTEADIVPGVFMLRIALEETKIGLPRAIKNWLEDLVSKHIFEE